MNLEVSNVIEINSSQEVEMLPNKIYSIKDNKNELTKFSLPKKSKFGDYIEIIGGWGKWKIIQLYKTKQQIIVASLKTSIGNEGYLLSDYPHNSVRLIRLKMNKWIVSTMQGNLTVV